MSCQFCFVLFINDLSKINKFKYLEDQYYFMDYFDISQLSESNPWWKDEKSINQDIKIKTFDEVKYKWYPALRHYISLDKDVIYTIRGPRQVGKTTLLKIIIKELINSNKINPENIFFWSFEMNNAEELSQIIQIYLNWAGVKLGDRKYLFFDEICSVKNWQREILHLSNKGLFENCSILITGSHSMDIKYSGETLPGRRGGSEDETLDKILLPMKFSEFVKLIEPKFNEILSDINLNHSKERHSLIFKFFEGEDDPRIQKLMLYKNELAALFDQYIACGGIPYVINEYMNKNKISNNTFNIYISSIIGDLRRYNFKENYFKQIIREICRTVSDPISWNNLSQNTDIKSHNTIQDYVGAMEELFVINTTYAYSIDKNRIVFNKNKKLYVQDPFIFHALSGWSNAEADYFINLKKNVLDLEIKSKIIEGIVQNHLCRLAYSLNPRDLFDPKDHVCYYRDKKGKEIDFLLLTEDKIYPFEVKYQSTIKKSDLSNFKSFGRGILVTKDKYGFSSSYGCLPVSLLLFLI